MSFFDDFTRRIDSPQEALLTLASADALVSADLPALRNDVYTLQIHNNLEGRLQFGENWPDVAAYIFGDELLSYDHRGTPDKIRRAWLENQADERRLEFVKICNHFEDKSLNARGRVNLEYVAEVIDLLGRDVASHLYSERVMDVFFPPEEDMHQEDFFAQEASPERMFVPMLPQQKSHATVRHEHLDPVNPFAHVALPEAGDLKGLTILKESVPKRGLRISWAQLKYRYEDEKQAD